MIEGPKSKKEWKRHAIAQLLQAAKHLMAAKPKSEEGKSWVAILLCYPNLWSSEVTVFFDKSYYEGFQPTDDLLTEKISEKFNIDLPSELIEIGYNVSWQDEDEHGEVYTHSERRWTIGEKAL